jgi:hypothetical protein
LFVGVLFVAPLVSSYNSHLSPYLCITKRTDNLSRSSESRSTPCGQCDRLPKHGPLKRISFERIQVSRRLNYIYTPQGPTLLNSASLVVAAISAALLHVSD